MPAEATGQPLVIYSNHASWWDPLVGLVLADRFFHDRPVFAPIDAAMLQRYRMFARLGFFGVERHSRRGAVQFLRTSEAILSSPGHVLAVTPQSRFADARERPVRFQSGLGHLASRVGHAIFLPMATEFVFWEERLPEILVRFGEPVVVCDGEIVTRSDTGPAEGNGVVLPVTADDWTALFEQRMTHVQDALAVEAQRRDASDFQTILSGRAGQGGIYDLWHAFRAKLRGEKFRREHGDK